MDHLETSHKGKYFDRVGKENVFILKYFAEGLENGTVWIPIKLTSSCGAIFFTTGKVVKDSFCLGVIFMGSLDEAKNYSITIQGNLLKGIDNWSGVVPSVESSGILRRPQNFGPSSTFVAFSEHLNFTRELKSLGQHF